MIRWCLDRCIDFDLSLTGNRAHVCYMAGHALVGRDAGLCEGRSVGRGASTEGKSHR